MAAATSTATNVVRHKLLKWRRVILTYWCRNETQGIQKSNLNKHLVWLSIRRLFVRPRILRHIHTSKDISICHFYDRQCFHLVMIFFTTSMLAVWEKSLYLSLFFFICFVVSISYVFTGAGSCLLCNRFQLMPDCSVRWIRLIQKLSCIKFRPSSIHVFFLMLEYISICLNGLRRLNLLFSCWFLFFFPPFLFSLFYHSTLVLLYSSIASSNRRGTSFSFLLVFLICVRFTCHQISLDDRKNPCTTKTNLWPLLQSKNFVNLIPVCRMTATSHPRSTRVSKISRESIDCIWFTLCWIGLTAVHTSIAIRNERL